LRFPQRFPASWLRGGVFGSSWRLTCYLLGRVFSADPSHPETVVNRMTAAFGLEFLIASWRSLWERS